MTSCVSFLPLYPAAAISDFIFAKYCYDTALKVGNSILNQTLMDYMNFA